MKEGCFYVYVSFKDNPNTMEFVRRLRIAEKELKEKIKLSEYIILNHWPDYDFNEINKTCIVSLLAGKKGE